MRVLLFLVIGVEIVIAIGYTLDIPIFFRSETGAGAHPLTLAGAVALAVGLARVSPVRLGDRVALMAFLLAAAIGALRLVEIAILGPSPAWEDILLRPELTEGHVVRLGSNTAMTLLAIALGQLLRRSAPRAATAVASLAPFPPMVALIGYSLGIPNLHGEMSPTSVIMLLPLAIIGLAMHVRRPVLRPMVASTVIGRMARIQMIFGMSLPWVEAMLRARQDIPMLAAEALLTGGKAWFIGALVLFGTYAVDRADARRRRVERLLRKVSVTDRLTGISNRYGATLAVDHRSFRRPVAVILVDLDHFKRVNDTYGHAVGDQVLVQAAETLRATLYHTDVLARWGGEEFLAVLPETDLTTAIAVAEKLRAALSRQLAAEGSPLNITGSFGVSVQAAHEPALEPAIRRADTAMYRAKAKGRNMVLAEILEGAAPAPGDNVISLRQL